MSTVDARLVLLHGLMKEDSPSVRQGPNTYLDVDEVAVIMSKEQWEQANAALCWEVHGGP